MIDAKITVDGLRAVKPMSEWQLTRALPTCTTARTKPLTVLPLKKRQTLAMMVVTADLSSTILSREIDVSRYGVILRGRAENIGPAGLTLIIVREDLLGKASVACPSILDYPFFLPMTPCLTRRRHLPGTCQVWCLVAERAGRGCRYG